jgi:purine-binding chemotaxis protein CheW
MKKDVVKLVTFQLGVDHFAVDVFSVERVLRYVAPSSVPDVPQWIEGVLPYRNTVIPVVDMRRRIALGDVSITPETRILVFTTTDGWIGAIVDAVLEVAIVAPASISPPPPLFRGLAGQFIKGIAKVGEQVIIVLDVDRVLTSGDRLSFEAVVQGMEPAIRG